MLRKIIQKANCSLNEKRKLPHYTKEFKQDAVRLVIDQGYSGPEAASMSRAYSGDHEQ
ncbi:MAG TPA: hypothetical protein VMW06_06075 [Desulfobacterales bacterium]|nr:hypothetical protein [Desulfobacterales bacterium]